MKDSDRMGALALGFFFGAALIWVVGSFLVVLVSCFTSGRFC